MKFHTIDTLLRNRKAVVFTADRLPGELELEDRLYYALQSGLVVGISEPDNDTAMEIAEEIVRRDLGYRNKRGGWM